LEKKNSKETDLKAINSQKKDEKPIEEEEKKDNNNNNAIKIANSQ
jgi:hypothetical protein